MRAEVKRIARRQQGLVTRAQVLESSTEREMRTWVTHGELEFVVQSLYRIGGAPVTGRQKVLAATISVGGVASHTTAAALWGLSSFPPKKIEVEVAHGGTRRSSLAEVHQTRSLEPIDITTIDHIPVTRVPRTLFDLADDHRIEDAVDDALCRRLVTLDRLSRRNEALKARGRSNLDAVLRTWTPGGMPDSVAEMRLVRRLVAHGLPEPERQVVINGLRVDLLYSEEKVILELDSFRWHGAPRGHARTMARQRELVAAGYAVLPVTVADLRGDGADLCDQVKSLLGLRAIPRLASGGR